MKTNKRWITTFILLIIELIIQYGFFSKPDLTKLSGIVTFNLDIIFNIIFFVVVGAGLGYLISKIPFRQKTFKEKFKTAIPLCTSFVIVVFISVFTYAYYLKKEKGIELAPLQEYEDIECPEDIDCSVIHTGKFESELTLIDRTEIIEIQTNKKTGVKQEFNINWIDRCEYVLTSTSDNSEQIKVKVIKATPQEYICNKLSSKQTDTYPILMIINRVK